MAMLRRAVLLGGVLIPALSTLSTPAAAAQGHAVASESPEASKAGLAILRKGGNAFDAVVTVALVSGVAKGSSSGLGGGGFAMYWDATTRTAKVLDFRETAPAAIDVGAFEQRPLPWERRCQLTGVPGELRGLYWLHSRYGKLPWKDVVAPAVQVATAGFRVTPHLAGVIKYSRKKLNKVPGLAAVYLPGGKPPRNGKRLRNPKLAQVLAEIAAGGPKAFYEGARAQEFVDAVSACGGSMTLKDLAAYQPVERAPLQAKRGMFTVFTMPPPSAGGMMLVQAMELLPTKRLAPFAKVTDATAHPGFFHLLGEAMRGSIADRMRFLGDPAYQRVDLPALTSAARMAKRRPRISLWRTHTVPRFNLDEHGTHHLVTRDGVGNVVSLTTTVNRGFGVKAVTAGGVVLNDELDDFTASEDVAAFGLKQSPNRARPGARPISSMTPTLVVDGSGVRLALGGSGGTTIATNVTQVTMRYLTNPMQTAAKLSAGARVYVPTSGPTLLVDDMKLTGFVKDLQRRGEVVAEMPFKTSGIQLVKVDGQRVQAAADPRKHGLGAVQ